MNNSGIYNELRLIDEYHANFMPSVQSEDRKTELMAMLITV